MILKNRDDIISYYIFINVYIYIYNRYVDSE